MKKVDNNRPRIRRKEIVFYIDEEGYASVIANIKRAEKCLYDDDIEAYYDKEGWIMLLMHYISVLRLLIDAYPESVKDVDIVDYNNLIYLKANKITALNKGRVYHKLPVDSEGEILHFVIMTANYIANILRKERSYNYDAVERYVAFSLAVSAAKANTEDYTTAWQQ